MDSTIKLFRAVPVQSKTAGEIDKEVSAITIRQGFVFAPEVFGNYSTYDLKLLAKRVAELIGLSAEQINSSFHKSWEKIKSAKIEQLVIEQIIHYFTTYGMERLGIYSPSSIYIPNEALETPELTDGFPLMVIRGYTKEEFKQKLLQMLSSGIALGEETIHAVTDIAMWLDLSADEIDSIKNREVKITLYNYLNIVPKDAVEFLRYCVDKATNKTLLIKNKETITTIKERQNVDITGLFSRYDNLYGLERLAECFYRFKPLFLAFRTNRKLKTVINKIRKLAYKHHKPMPEDYLNSVTAKIKRGEGISTHRLQQELAKVNIFRKARLAHALKYRIEDIDTILYRIRNGKGYATDFKFINKDEAEASLNLVVDNIVDDLRDRFSGKKVYIPENVVYALPTTEKQFTGMFPSGTCIKVAKNMVFGVHWKNVESHRIDLDLSLVSTGVKYGWDGLYRSGNRSILFSGDMTDASGKGSSELFYIKQQVPATFLVCLNYFNYNPSVEVPFKIIIACEYTDKLTHNYMVNPNNVIAITGSKINQPQIILGIVEVNKNESRFYFSETVIGRSITVGSTPYAEAARKYLSAFYQNQINLNNLIEQAGGVISPLEDCELDLSFQKLEKDTFIKLLDKNQ